eukprot:TRINITY_DN27719_c0_g1_i1.p1 TRINITY_DN27719_c0_g1~~TRINITY_DN27719_c0_g1_i1.p1  ORF type:complete len:916 (+),score=275.77 TRINITY_DN27719_c0_g1_i1:83-2830(+)
MYHYWPGHAPGAEGQGPWGVPGPQPVPAMPAGGAPPAVHPVDYGATPYGGQHHYGPYDAHGGVGARGPALPPLGYPPQPAGGHGAAYYGAPPVAPPVVPSADEAALAAFKDYIDAYELQIDLLRGQVQKGRRREAAVETEPWVPHDGRSPPPYSGSHQRHAPQEMTNSPVPAEGDLGGGASAALSALVLQNISLQKQVLEGGMMGGGMGPAYPPWMMMPPPGGPGQMPAGDAPTDPRQMPHPAYWGAPWGNHPQGQMQQKNLTPRDPGAGAAASPASPHINGLPHAPSDDDDDDDDRSVKSSMPSVRAPSDSNNTTESSLSDDEAAPKTKEAVLNQRLRVLLLGYLFMYFLKKNKVKASALRTIFDEAVALNYDQSEGLIRETVKRAAYIPIRAFYRNQNEAMDYLDTTGAHTLFGRRFGKVSAQEVEKRRIRIVARVTALVRSFEWYYREADALAGDKEEQRRRLLSLRFLQSMTYHNGTSYPEGFLTSYEQNFLLRKQNGLVMLKEGHRAMLLVMFLLVKVLVKQCLLQDYEQQAASPVKRVMARNFSLVASIIIAVVNGLLHEEGFYGLSDYLMKEAAIPGLLTGTHLDPYLEYLRDAGKIKEWQQILRDHVAAILEQTRGDRDLRVRDERKEDDAEFGYEHPVWLLINPSIFTNAVYEFSVSVMQTRKHLRYTWEEIECVHEELAQRLMLRRRFVRNVSRVRKSLAVFRRATAAVSESAESRHNSGRGSGAAAVAMGLRKQSKGAAGELFLPVGRQGMGAPGYPPRAASAASPNATVPTATGTRPNTGDGGAEVASAPGSGSQASRKSNGSGIRLVPLPGRRAFPRSPSAAAAGRLPGELQAEDTGSNHTVLQLAVPSMSRLPVAEPASAGKGRRSRKVTLTKNALLDIGLALSSQEIKNAEKRLEEGDGA